MRRLFSFILVTILFSFTEVSANFLQEVELKDGTILVGYVYRQQPSKFMVFHVNHARKDSKAMFHKQDMNYILQWKDVKYIRKSQESDKAWCDDKITLKDGTVYIGQIEEQEVGVSMTIRCNDNEKLIVVKNSELKTIEKVTANIDKDLWIDRQYTNQLKLSDRSIHEGLIVLQYRGVIVSDCFVELLHSSGYRERIFLPDISEYIIKLQ